MSEERLEPVTDFASLRSGMIVVVKPCDRCRRRDGDGRGHRGILVAYQAGAAYRDANGAEGTEDTWTIAPEGRCGADAFGRDDVLARCVFRVVDGLDPEADRKQDTSDELHADVHAIVVRRGAKVRP